MTKVRAVVLRAAGINCDMETEHALGLAGADAECQHINALIGDPGLLDACQILVFPGGFSYGDDVAAGRILANQVMHHLQEAVLRFIEQGKLVLGICNGFQVLVKAGILPGFADSQRQDTVTITYNDSGKFEDRWVYLAPQTQRCVFIEPETRIYLPIAHGEGKVVTVSPEVLNRLETEGHVAYTYVDADGQPGDYPVNPNGSTHGIAGLTDTTGRVLGLMPHPERFVTETHHPRWSRHPEGVVVDGIGLFQRAVAYAGANL